MNSKCRIGHPPCGTLVRLVMLLMALLLVGLSLPAGATFEIAVNCGGDSLAGGSGRTFLADQPWDGVSWGYVGGYSAGSWNPIGGAPDSILYRTVRSSNFAFDYYFNVPNGLYEVTLHFSDVINHWYGMSAMRLECEGVALLTGFDIFEFVERCYALDTRFLVEVTDELMNINFTPEQGFAQVCALEIVTAGAAPGPPGPPANLRVIPGYDCMIVDWDPVDISNLKGYRVERRRQSSALWHTVQEPEFLMTRYIDENVQGGDEFSYRISAVDLAGSSSNPCPPLSGTVRHRYESQLRDYEIFALEPHLILLNQNILSDDYIPIDFQWGTHYWEEAGVRYRGKSNIYGPKKNWKVALFEGSLEGQDRVNLNSGYADPSLIREAFGFRMAELAGSPTCRTRRINLYLNGRHRGLHTQIEQIDEDWLQTRDIPESSPVFKCYAGLHILPEYEYQNWYIRGTGDSTDLQPIIDLIDTIHNTPDDEFPEVISGAVDLVYLANWYAFQVLNGNRDFATHNFYAVLDESRDRWFFIPWDLDVTYGSSGTYLHTFDPYTPIDIGTEAHPDVRGFNGLINRLLQFPQFRWMIAKRITDLLNGPYALQDWRDELQAQLDEIAADVDADFHKWGWETSGLQAEHAGRIENYIEQRHAFLLTAAASYSPDLDPGLRLNEFMAKNETTIRDEFGEYEDWIEVMNISDHPIDLGGMRLSDDLRNPRKWAFPDTIIPSAGYLLVWADNDPEQGPLHATFKLDADGETVALWESDEDGNVLLDHLDFGQQTEDVSLARMPDGFGDWVYSTTPTPGDNNDPASSSEPRQATAAVPSIRIAPNPVTDRVTLTLLFKEASMVTARAPLGIYDAAGRRVAVIELEGTPPSTTIRLKDLRPRPSPGIYWIRPLRSVRPGFRAAKIIYLGD
ncbi:MAG: CotH kinase family protein [Candidatus Eisenbacteria bacterium]|uniref:CotH kinase family protein n=1 Tax=Eiseniibacteriota bacterium TaxID=2212470 RepID=A0A948RWZ3_UNCEI|nr:CotH kinase family protein [Candidatus Eisenbacteria bacterium]MBU1947774.1 CotH kinase family protein [Candidatus Eisenbacteria bacterium]MBU2691082.1 CotH kinase family protein [Candidatus Eisenbacteria bacterium]